MSLRALFTAARASRRRSRSPSTARSIWCACAGTRRRGATRCASRRRRREIVLTMPPRGSLTRGARIRAEARRLDRGAAGAAAARRSVRATATMVPLRGVDASHRASARRARHGVDRSERRRPRCCASPATRAHVGRRVRDFLKREAKRDLEAASRRYAAALGVTVKRVAVRDQTSRWGSCSTTGVLSYSWRLDPRAALRARLSRGARGRASRRDESFARGSGGWSTRICPDWQRAKAWLDAHGTELHRYGEDGTPPESASPY